MKVSICISTYNGILFFDEQIKSILSQTYRDFSILIRDDGSTDNLFIERLKLIEKQHKQVNVYFEENIGVTRSFFELIRKCPIDSDFIVFADQDDVWNDMRLENTFKHVKHESINLPLLSFCSLEYVDENLNHISILPKFKHVGFNNALVQNLATGCTICINNSALRMLLVYSPKHSVIHDWWIYLVVSATGKVIQEPNVSVKYRQHSFNVLGGTTSTVKKNKKRVKRKLNQIIYKVYAQVSEFYSIYANLISEENSIFIKNFLKTNNSFISKLLFVFDFKTVKRETFYDDILLKIVILISRINKK